MNAGTMTFKERELMKQATVTIKVERSTGHRFLMWSGVQLMKFGALVAGVGVVVIEGESK